MNGMVRETSCSISRYGLVFQVEAGKSEENPRKIMGVGKRL